MIVGLLGMSILAVVFGHVALRQIKRSGDWITGKGFAIAGVVLGWIQIAVLAVIATILIVVGSGGAAEERREAPESTAVEADATPPIIEPTPPVIEAPVAEATPTTLPSNTTAGSPIGDGLKRLVGSSAGAVAA